MALTIIMVFLLGVVNFTLHKAAMESGHPVIDQTRSAFARLGGSWVSYALEFAILLGALNFAWHDKLFVIPLYCVYSGINGLAAWAILTGRI